MSIYQKSYLGFDHMSANSRTSKSIKNSLFALVFYFINLILQFFSRKIFLDYLGAEVLGLNTTATNLLQFLNLAELGIGSAIACTLYKPLYEKDQATINEIVSLQGWLYQRIAWIVIAGSIVLMAFFPWIFAKMPLPLWYAYASFGVLLVSALLSYFVNYKQIILSADQKEYKILYSYKVSMLVKLLCQLLAIRYLNNGYVWWLILEVVFAVVASVALNHVIACSYPYLKTDMDMGKELAKKYPGILVKIKQLFFHKIAGFALTQTSPIIIYVYTTLTIVALYGNYMLVILGVITFSTVMFNGITAGIGNLIAQGDKQRVVDVFEELFSVNFLLSNVICFGVYKLLPPFIKLWIGPEYLLDDMTLVLLVIYTYFCLTRQVIIAYINAYGLFEDIWAPIAEAVINIGMSILLGYFYGLNGVLVGNILSLFLIVFCWKPYLLYIKGIKKEFNHYIVMYVKHLSVLLISLVVVSFMLNFFKLEASDSFLNFILLLVMYNGMFLLILFGVSFCVIRSVRSFFHRFFNI